MDGQTQTQTQTNVLQEPSFGKNYCFECKKEIHGKPWIILCCEDDYHIFGCSFSCSKDLNMFMGGSYWDKVVNKEDFLKDPIPYHKKNNNIEMCFNDSEIEEIREEILEEERIQMYEREYDSSSEDNYEDVY